MSKKMKNPYEEWGSHPEEVRIGKSAAWIFSVLFIALIVLPPSLRNIHNRFCTTENQWTPLVEFFHHPNLISEELLANKKRDNPDIERKQPNLQDHLRSFESKLEKAEYAIAIRRWMQVKLTAGLQEGNSKSVLGKEGRLYYQTAIDSLVGYGPLQAEPDSVMKNPDRAIWTPPLQVIENFAAQLKQRGIELLLVPVPIKPMIYPEDIGRGTWQKPALHKDQLALYDQLRKSGVEVLDLSKLFWSLKDDGDVFLKQDTHWTQGAMQHAAAKVATAIKSKPWFAGVMGDLKTSQHKLAREHQGDLVEMLELFNPEKIFTPEAQTLTVIKDAASGTAVTNYPQSPIVLLGDSFVNIYDDASIGFGDPNWKPKDENDSEPLIGAGFAQHLAAQLQTSINSYTSNGGGATQVRKDFAQLADNEVRTKKLVVWVLASRDLLLSETPGTHASIRWRDVEFSKRISTTPSQSVDQTGKPLVIEATLKERTALQDPQSTPYKEAIYSAIFTLDKKAEAKLKIEGNEVPAYLWGFRKRTVVASGRLEAGKKYRLTLVPWSSKTNLQSVQKMDDLFVLSDWWFVEQAELIE